MLSRTRITILLYAIVVHLISQSFAGMKLWPMAGQFRDSINWKHSPPCNHDEIHFPENFDTVLPLPTLIEAVGLILPIEGIILPTNNFIMDFQDRKKSKMKDYLGLCKNSNNLAEFKKPKPGYWFDPSSWQDFPNIEEENLAKPHVERIPCSNDKVLIRHVGPVSIDMEGVTNLYLGSLNLDNIEIRSTQLERIFHTELGLMMFKNSHSTRVRYFNKPICGCHKQDQVVEYEQLICSHTFENCSIPKCKNPIHPTGHCCPLCGAVLHVHVSNCFGFSLERLRTQINDEIINRKLNTKLSFYISTIAEGTRTYLQLIIIDTNEYNEESVEFMKIINKTITIPSAIENFPRILYSSGVPYDPELYAVSGWVYVFSTLFVVLTFFLIIYLQYGHDYPLLSLPNWLTFNRYRVFNSPFVFARFDNTGHINIENDNHRRTDDVDCPDSNRPVDYQSVTEAILDPTSGTTSFNNPMFNESENETKTKSCGSGSGSVINEGFIMMEESITPPIIEDSKELIEVNLTTLKSNEFE